MHNATWWSSTLLMYDRFLLWFDVVNETLSTFNENPVGYRVVIQELVMLLKPFAKCTVLLQSAHVSIIGMMLAELAGLFNSVSQMKPRLTTNVAKRVSSHLLINLSRRFHLDNMLSSHRTALLAAILDVRMKYLCFLPIHMRDAAWDILKEEYEIEKAASANQSTASTQRAAKPASTANSDHEC